MPNKEFIPRMKRKHEAEFLKLKALSDDDDNGDLELNEEMKELEKQLMKKDP